jgi:hypothetical protein
MPRDITSEEDGQSRTDTKHRTDDRTYVNRSRYDKKFIPSDGNKRKEMNVNVSLPV